MSETKYSYMVRDVWSDLSGNIAMGHDAINSINNYELEKVLSRIIKRKEAGKDLTKTELAVLGLSLIKKVYEWSYSIGGKLGKELENIIEDSVIIGLRSIDRESRTYIYEKVMLAVKMYNEAKSLIIKNGYKV